MGKINLLGKHLVDEDVSVTNRHELDLHVSDNASSNERCKVAHQYMVLVLAYHRKIDTFG